MPALVWWIVWPIVGAVWWLLWHYIGLHWEQLLVGVGTGGILASWVSSLPFPIRKGL